MHAWQRKRQPDEVPAPVAIALSHFCRATGAPATAVAVREALSAIDESDDARVLTFIERAEPDRRLGPMAVVDIATGTDEALATQRHAAGYYDLALELLRASAPPPPRAKPERSPIPAPAPTPVERSTSSGMEARGRRGDKKAAKALAAISARIAPKKRAPSPPAPPAPTPPEPSRVGPAHLRKRPPPKGRFVEVKAQRLPWSSLTGAEGRVLVRDLIEQHRSRFSVARTLHDRFEAPPEGRATGEVVLALARSHRLERDLLNKERAELLQALSAAAGDVRGAAKLMELSNFDFDSIASLAGLEERIPRFSAERKSARDARPTPLHRRR